MRVLVACEESQTIAIAFRLRGFEAYSCDILPCSGGYPEFHIQDDVRNHLDGWDLIIAHPPCDHLAVSGARWFPEKRADGRQQAAVAFFLVFTQVDCKHVAIENPVSIMSSTYRKPNQIVEPWMFGHPEQKKTCLWLKDLPLLTQTNNVHAHMLTLPRAKRERIHFMPKTEDRARIRSKTYIGLADAMADQWGDYIRKARWI